MKERRSRKRKEVGGEEGEGGRERLKRELYFVGSQDSYHLCVQMWDRGKTGSLGVREVRAGIPAVLAGWLFSLTDVCNHSDARFPLL